MLWPLYIIYIFFFLLFKEKKLDPVVILKDSLVNYKQENGIYLNFLKTDTNVYSELAILSLNNLIIIDKQQILFF